MASGAVFTDGGSLQVGHPQEWRQACNGRWYTEEEFRWYYEKAWRSYWDGARRETVPLCASQSVFQSLSTELPSTHVAPPASSVLHAAELAAALVVPVASTGAHAVEPAAAPATPGASTKAPAAETAAAPVAPGASRPGLSEGAKPHPPGKSAAAGPAAGLATLRASTVVHAVEPAVAPVSSKAFDAAHAVENIAGPLAPGASQPGTMPPGGAAEHTACSPLMVQIITCGAGAKYAGISDRLDLLWKYSRRTESREGWDLRNGLKAFVRYYMKDERDSTEIPPGPYDETRDIYLDARVLSDPDGARDHTGRHRDIIARMVDHQNFRSWMRNAHRTLKRVFMNWTGGPIVPVVVFCRSGRHRAVAASELLKGALLRVEGWRFAPTKHITIDIDREGCLCEDCKPDREICESIENSIALAVSALDLRDTCDAGSGAVSILARAASGA